MNISEFIKKHQSITANQNMPFRPLPHIVCNDGLTFSVQASQYHYCTPREDNCEYSEVEIGFPSQKIEQLMRFAEDADNPTGTVYGWVPIEVVDEIISEHGGIKNG